MSAIYTPAMLALSTELIRYPFDESFSHQAEARSSVCGSALRVGLNLDSEGRVIGIGLKVSACAVGQSSAAILAGAVQGAAREDISQTFDDIQRWLSGEGDQPQWPRFDTLAGARERPGRHGALRLPWEAALAALSQDQLQP
ncbi:MAG: iron-sulfur cluster assembly scaffold protein [Pseudomonadota bacterium]